MKKRYLLVPVLVAGIIIGGMTITKGNAYLDMDGLNQQVQRHDEQLNNHEIRIKNNENDIKDVQDKTDTPPSSSNSVAPEVVTPVATQVERPASTPQVSNDEQEVTPKPITVVSYRQIPIEGTENIDCEYTYSDGTTYQWHWTTIEYNQGSKITSRIGSCSEKSIGNLKSQ